MTASSFRFKKAEIGVFNQESAGPAVDTLAHGAHIVGLTMGQFSLIDLIHAVLKKTGPADVYIATWSAGIKDAHQVRWMVDNGLIRGIRLLTDHSYVNRQKRYVASIEELFGKENIRCAEMHAKYVIIRNADWNVVILSSMNLNANKTCEVFAVHEDKSLADFFMGYIEHHFHNLHDGWERSSAIVSEAMRSFFANESKPKVEARPPSAEWWSDD